MMDKTVPDLLRPDIQMPGMDGFEVCTRIKGNSSPHHVPIIFITAIKTGSEDAVKGFDADGAELYNQTLSVRCNAGRSLYPFFSEKSPLGFEVKNAFPPEK